ncbi:MAG: amidohydrolase [Actinobacteria bacterium]|nr:amidohydrolase [Actinomycetota bacterium]
MIVDTHTHLFADDRARFPLSPGRTYDPRTPGSAELLRAEMDAARVERAVVISPYVYRWDNRYVMDCWQRFGDWLAVAVLVDPRAPDGPDTLRRLVADGASGLRIHGDINGLGPYDDPATTPLWRAAADLNVPLDACAALEEYPEIERRVRELPALRVILDHCGYIGGRWNPTRVDLEPVLALARYPNVYAKLTFLGSVPDSPWPHANAHWMVRRILDAYGPERCLWGSNFPTKQYNPSATYAQHVDVFRTHLELTPDERRWVMGGTAQTLWKWRT